MSAGVGRPMSAEDREYIERFPVECTESVTRKSRGEALEEPCDRVAVAVRYDPNFGDAYPVCARHARGDMAALADLLGPRNLCGGTPQRDTRPTDESEAL